MHACWFLNLPSEARLCELISRTETGPHHPNCKPARLLSGSSETPAAALPFLRLASQAIRKERSYKPKAAASPPMHISQRAAHSYRLFQLVLFVSL